MKVGVRMFFLMALLVLVVASMGQTRDAVKQYYDEASVHTKTKANLVALEESVTLNQQQFAEENGGTSYLDSQSIDLSLRNLEGVEVLEVAELSDSETGLVDLEDGTELAGYRYLLKGEDLFHLVQSIDMLGFYSEELDVDYTNKTVMLKVRVKEANT